MWNQSGGIRSVGDVEKALASSPSAETARAVAAYLKRTQPRDGDFGPRRPRDLKNTQSKDSSRGPDLTRGAMRPPQAFKKVIWFLEAPPAANVSVISKSGETWTLKPLGDTGLHVAVATTPPVVEYRFQYVVDGQQRGAGAVQIENYELGPNHLPQPGVPQGKVVKMAPFVSTKAYPGWSHEWWMYIPPGTEKGDDSLALMVFLDGKSYIDGDCPTTAVFDNLIHQKKMPPCVGVFVQPGTKQGMNPQRSRSDEYDTCTPRFAEFLERELLPEAAKTCRFSNDPKRRAICGASSGGSGAFTAAWHRPDLFHRVLSQIGSFCDFRSLESYPSFDGRVRPDVERFQTWKVAHDYPALIRKTRPAKPLRVFLQEGERDLDNQLGNWPLANRQMDKALEYAGYQHKLVMGQGFHNRKHGRAIMPEALAWLWSDD
jgi:enterochelin esterase family protein